MYDAEHIILVDDNDNDRELHKAALRTAGFTGELSAFNSATDALSGINGDTFNGRKTLMLLDINMPKLDGFGLVAEMVGTLESHAEVSIVMLSGSTDGRDQSRARTMPMVSDYFVKPLTVDGSITLMRKFLA
jgi:DNA-binding response OmpR family regulator